eukprot:TRINITY_DN3566_c0_g1_i3.p2 TRINITY_DN3566_c0_g1~~TRINITY_DN3566_c0_g1_i3.p2  ORF type:complete len:175 (+),score=6.76 TRINITY_DN3566_c0_g1_i3:131-655(+)
MCRRIRSFSSFPLAPLSSLWTTQLVCFVFDHTHNIADPLRFAFTEDKASTLLHILRLVLEAKAHTRRDATPQHALEAHNLRRLASTGTMHHRFILVANGGGVRDDKDLGVELPHRLWFVRRRKHHLALSCLAALHLFQRKRYRLPRFCTLDRETARVNSFDGGGAKLTRAIRTQ